MTGIAAVLPLRIINVGGDRRLCVHEEVDISDARVRSGDQGRCDARDGQDGINKIREFRPDIVTLDIEMPVLDGLSALRIIMKEIPLPVIMISSLTSEGAQAMLDALNLGAVDFIPKEALVRLRGYQEDT